MTPSALPADGAVTGTVVITAAALPGAGLVEFTVSAVITGGQPGTVYDLDGNDCSTISPLGDHVWATGVTSAAGVFKLTLPADSVTTLVMTTTPASNQK